MTSADLFSFVGDPKPTLLFLDEVDAAIADLRLRLLLSEAARGRWPDLSIVVTSCQPPPVTFPAAALKGVAFSRKAGASSPSASPPGPVLEMLAASSWATSGWMLGLATGHRSRRTSLETPTPVARALKREIAEGTVQRVRSDATGEWFRLPDRIRSQILDRDRAPGVHAAIAEAFQGERARLYVELAARGDPQIAYELDERVVAHLVAAGDVDGAVMHYWHVLGNFSTLQPAGQIHLGARVCRTLNGEHPPDRPAGSLQQAKGAYAVLNDWSQFAASAGDTRTAVAAAQSAYEQARRHDGAPWDQALLACHVAEGLRAGGDLPEALMWASRAKDYATRGLRKTEGLPSRENMDAVDNAAEASIKVAALTGGAEGVAREIEELAAIHERQRGVLRRLNELATFPYPGPTGEVDVDRLLDGRASATLALLENRGDDAIEVLQRNSSGRPAHRVLLLRARLLAAPADPATGELLASLRREADEHDDAEARCELAALASEVALGGGDPEAALAVVDDSLGIACGLRLALCAIDLLTVRSRALLALGRQDEAQASAAAALYGAEPGDLPGAADPSCGYQMGAGAAVAALQAAGGEPSPQALAVAAPSGPPETTDGRRTPRVVVAHPPAVDPETHRVSLHDAAWAVLEDYDKRGLPFVLYFRTFDINVMHGPMEYGPRLIENSLRESLPPGVNVLTIQDHGDFGYTGSYGVAGRGAPALLVEDEHWEEVVTGLIPFADLIVSECLMLSAGVRAELEAIQRWQRWDRTVLVLPPLRSPFQPIDNDPLVQRFPLCVWADAFHTQSLIDLAPVKVLVERMGKQAALPEADRAALTDPDERLRAFPIDLLSFASDAEHQTTLEATFGDENDERVRYHGFWNLFRAVALRMAALSADDRPGENRTAAANDLLGMSVIMLDAEEEEDRIVLIGDLTFAQQCAVSAYSLANNVVNDDDSSDTYRMYARNLRDTAEQQLTMVVRATEAVERAPERFVLRPRFGPFTVQESSLNEE